MENFAQDISKTLPTVGEERKTPLASIPERLTHISLPKLIIKPYTGRVPRHIPKNDVEFFLNIMAANKPRPITLLPLPVYPASPTRGPCSPSDGESQDPYLVDLPTPVTIQFTRNEATELKQWRETVGGMREAHGKALDKLGENLRDTKLRAEVRKLRLERERQADAIAQMHDRRKIRKAFRKDFNNLLPGW
ncbi:hypothetical protein GQX73_g7351 [Xylaria multiplex]|uniref:Uncharacterized protein n=1 Tax=Xylaria multiplex TaxID=323545 RepID=A0A7C8ITR7_9PEZI|nr:hypothetical protein GQX73_g7351 [Xylaria multiplex]